MKFLTFFLTSILISTFSWADHGLEEGINLIKYGALNPRALIIKIKDSQTPKVNRGGAIDNIGQKLEIASSVKYATGSLFSQKSRNLYSNFRNKMSRNKKKMPKFDNYFLVRFKDNPSKEEAIEILKKIYENPSVEFALFEPIAMDAVMERKPSGRLINLPEMLFGERKPATPNFETQQFHLEPAPIGVDARFAWNFPGGAGKGIRIVDLETGWHDGHMDFKKPFYDNGKNQHTDHGTAVWGEIAAKRDGTGVTGIAYDSEFGLAGTGWTGNGDYVTTVAQSLDEAVTQMEKGDLLIIEQHMAGPDHGKYTAIEYFRPIFDILKVATLRGVHCVAAAGNGNTNFDDPSYQGAFDLNIRDSGCTIVGAGSPPGGYNGTPHLHRLDFSNYGSRVDTFGYGRNVVTTGYGDLFGSNENEAYTKEFSGTSSATPIVTGVVASVLGASKMNRRWISPEEIRAALRKTGTPQQGNTHERIGNLPNLKELYQAFEFKM